MAERDLEDLPEQVRASVALAGRFYAQQRERVEHTCEECGRKFTGLRKARYCSAKCKQRSYRKRIAEEPANDESGAGKS